MLKGIVSGVEKDIKRIPMLVGNEYKEGWEVRDNQDRLIWGREDELQTTTGALPFKGYGLPVKMKSLLGAGQQTDTPTPAAPIMPDFVGTLDGTDWTIPITCAGQTVPVYLGQVSTVRNIYKLVLTGNEGWGYTSGMHRIIISDNLYKREIERIAICSHYEAIINQSSASIQNNQLTFLVSSSGNNYMYIRDTRYDNTEDFKSYLAAQYAAGTPVTVWYALATPETGIVNEPLAKIGYYADELNDTVATLPEIPTTTGQNTLTVDTTLAPSNLTVKGHVKALT